MEQILKLTSLIKKSKNILLLAHISPDGDTLGSMLALKSMLKQIDNVEKIDALITGKVPEIYRFLPGSDSIKNPNDSELYKSYDLAITLDCASIDRLGENIDIFRNAKTTANIDHHISNSGFADINIIIPDAAACGQVLFELIEPLDITITKDIANCLYTSILTDTGGFKFENTKAKTFSVCAELIKNGADSAHIYKECYESKPYEMVMLHANIISQAIMTDDKKIVYASISRKMLQQLNSSDDYVDGIAEALRQINSVDVAIVFKETVKGNTKLSFRSNRVNVCDIAKYFGGGGHKLAAGCTINKNIKDSIEDVLPIVKKLIYK